MSVADYVADIRRHILDTPHIVSHSLGYEERPPLGAIVNGFVTFADGSRVHFKEFLQFRPVTTRLKYVYHYTSSTHGPSDMTMPAIPRLGTSPHTPTIFILPTVSFHRSALRSPLLCARRPHT
ncbi:hypothetical protein COMA2_60010 [Candidatus Nitrospira nitrificans]|uniref:Uncharacterized protein n=1 Tax=Candidatus Nitrospira nitrificans TaxID=1742973 RepID=A0A0S4LMM2_9BACT|nr:hypothetical protein COMA2_60010 [Candidatus Nitrospira nitrificans]